MLTIKYLDADNWNDFAGLCHEMGPNRSCWCMWWRHDGARSEMSARERARALVRATPVPIGLLAYEGPTAIGWVAVGWRTDYPRLNRGRDTAPVDETRGVWAIPCFFVREDYRGKGVARALLDAAVQFAAENGAYAVEGIPGDPATRTRSASASYTGTVEMFRRAGFTEVARRTPKGRVVMRKYVHPKPAL